MNQLRTYILVIVVLLSALWAGCGPPTQIYINEQADFGFYEKVGMTPFSNLTSERSAAEKVASSFTTSLLMQNVVETAAPGDFLRTFREFVKGDRMNIAEELTAEEVINMGKAAGVQGIFAGAVREYGLSRVGSEEFPLVGVTIRFFDCQSGKVVWSFETTRRGGPGFPVVSFGETHTLGDLTTKITRQAAEKFAAAVK
jgi:hypothetical protein